MIIFPFLAAAFLTQATIVGFTQTGPNVCQMDYVLEGRLYTQSHPCPDQFIIAQNK